MKIMTNSEMRAIDGGFRLVCDLCGKTCHTHSKLVYTAFVLGHGAGHSSWVRYDNKRYRNSLKQNCCW